MTTQFQDVQAFQAKFGVPNRSVPTQLPPDEFQFRYEFLQEELEEYALAYRRGDLVGQLDALIDLVYVALGTAAMSGLPFDQGFEVVHGANMRKTRVARGEGRHGYDVVKPRGWVAPEPQLKALLDARRQRDLFDDVESPAPADAVLTATVEDEQC